MENQEVKKHKQEIKNQKCEKCKKNYATLLSGGFYLCNICRNKPKKTRTDSRPHNNKSKIDYRRKRLKEDNTLITALSEYLQQRPQNELISINHLKNNLKFRGLNVNVLKILFLLRECKFKESVERIVKVTPKAKNKLNQLKEESEK